MYGKVGSLGASAGVGAATLPYTGFNLTWLFIGGATLLAVGFATWRVCPRKEH